MPPKKKSAEELAKEKKQKAAVAWKAQHNKLLAQLTGVKLSVARNAVITAFAVPDDGAAAAPAAAPGLLPEGQIQLTLFKHAPLDSCKQMAERIQQLHSTYLDRAFNVGSVTALAANSQRFAALQRLGERLLKLCKLYESDSHDAKANLKVKGQPIVARAEKELHDQLKRDVKLKQHLVSGPPALPQFTGQERATWIPMPAITLTVPLMYHNQCNHLLTALRDELIDACKHKDPVFTALALRRCRQRVEDSMSRALAHVQASPLVSYHSQRLLTYQRDANKALPRFPGGRIRLHITPKIKFESNIPK